MLQPINLTTIFVFLSLCKMLSVTEIFIRFYKTRLLWPKVVLFFINNVGGSEKSRLLVVSGEWIGVDWIRLDCHVSNIMQAMICLLYTSPSPRDRQKSRMPSSA